MLCIQLRHPPLYTLRRLNSFTPNGAPIVLRLTSWLRVSYSIKVLVKYLKWLKATISSTYRSPVQYLHQKRNRCTGINCMKYVLFKSRKPRNFFAQVNKFFWLQNIIFFEDSLYRHYDTQLVCL